MIIFTLGKYNPEGVQKLNEKSGYYLQSIIIIIVIIWYVQGNEDKTRYNEQIFKCFFTDTLINKFDVTQWSLMILSYFKCITTLPCECEIMLSAFEF